MDDGGRVGAAAHLRTAFVLFHVLAVWVMAFPAPSGGMVRSTWKDPTVQAEFEAWRERLAGWGWQTTPEGFEDGLWALASAWMDVRAGLLVPFSPYYDCCGTWQSWRMFVAPHVYPTRLHVDVHTAEGWQPVFAERSDAHTWLRPVFDHDRMRSATFRYAWSKYARSYGELVRWLAKRAAADFPAADQVRVRYLRGRSPTPEEVRAGVTPETSWELEKIVKLDPLR
jgi:hypothetical protein